MLVRNCYVVPEASFVTAELRLEAAVEVAAELRLESLLPTLGTDTFGFGFALGLEPDPDL